MPVMGYPVRGSSPDKTTVEETVDNLSRWKMKNLTLVWDRGFVSKSNIDYARKENFQFLSGGPIFQRRMRNFSNYSIFCPCAAN
jgi:transposase